MNPFSGSNKRQRSDETEEDEPVASSSGSSSKIAELEKKLEDSKAETKKALEEAKKAQDEKKKAEDMLVSTGLANKVNVEVHRFFSFHCAVQ